jgi:hypothetical protein
MAQLRAIWPDVERALNVGHTLRVIHRRLNQMGIPTTYRRLTVYRGRLQREKEKNGRVLANAQTIVPPIAAGKDGGSALGSKAFDPLRIFGSKKRGVSFGNIRLDLRTIASSSDERKPGKGIPT